MKSNLILAAGLAATQLAPTVVMAGTYPELDALIETNPIHPKYAKGGIDLLFKNGILPSDSVQERRLNHHAHHHHTETATYSSKHEVQNARNSNRHQQNNNAQRGHVSQQDAGNQQYGSSSQQYVQNGGEYNRFNDDNGDTDADTDAHTDDIVADQNDYWDDDDEEEGEVVTDEWTDDWTDDWDAVDGDEDGDEDGDGDDWTDDWTEENEPGDVDPETGEDEDSETDGDDGEDTPDDEEEPGDVDTGRDGEDDTGGDQPDDMGGDEPEDTDTDIGREGEDDGSMGDDSMDRQILTRVAFEGFFHKEMSTTVVLKPLGNAEICDAANPVSGEFSEPGTTFLFRDAPLEDIEMLMFGPLMGVVQGACKRTDCFGKAYCQVIIELLDESGRVALAFNAEGAVENGQSALSVTGGQNTLLGVAGQVLMTPADYSENQNDLALEMTEATDVDFLEGTDGYMLLVELLLDPRFQVDL